MRVLLSALACLSIFLAVDRSCFAADDTPAYDASNPVFVIPKALITSFDPLTSSKDTSSLPSYNGETGAQLNLWIYNAFEDVSVQSVTDGVAMAASTDVAAWCAKNATGVVVTYEFGNDTGVDLPAIDWTIYQVALHWQVHKCDNSIIHPPIQTSRSEASDTPKSVGGARANVSIPLNLLTTLAGIYNLVSSKNPLPAQQVSTYTQIIGAVNTAKSTFLDKTFDYPGSAFRSASQVMVSDYCYSAKCAKR